MPKNALKFVWAASRLGRKHRRTNWYRVIALTSTFVTLGLIALYFSRIGLTG